LLAGTSLNINKLKIGVDIKQQVIDIVLTLVIPKKTFLSFPTNKILLFVLLTQLSILITKTIQKYHDSLVEQLGSLILALTLIAILNSTAFFTWGLVTKLICRLFGKQLNFFQIINIMCYSTLVYNLIELIVINFLKTYDIRPSILWLFNGTVVTLQNTIVNLLLSILGLYSLFLFIYGLYISPHQFKESTETSH